MAVAARRSRSACTHPMAARVVAATRNSVVRRKGLMADLLNARRAARLQRPVDRHDELALRDALTVGGDR